MTRTRFAPSPTGFLHIGGLRTAAYAYALAKHSGGQFFLRIEDTDQKREVKNATQKIYDILQKFNLRWDEDPVIQSQRLEIYQEAAEKLVSSDHAVFEDGAIRLSVPKGETITFHDFVLDKDVSWKSEDVPAAVLLKSDGFPTYHLAMPVDDHAMGISHVIRTMEWLPSTPIHILVFRYLGYDLPQIGHPSAILNPAGGKLSKRRGNVSVEQFLEAGYLPEAILNFVILLGWAPKDNRELFTRDEFVKAFDINGFQKSNPIFTTQKLDWFNGHYIRQKSNTELTQLLKPFVKNNLTDTQITQIVPLVKDRLVRLSEFDQLTYFFVHLSPLPSDVPISSAHLRFAKANFDKLLSGELIDDIKAQGWKVGDFFMSLRVAICGSRSTPPITETMQILGKEESLKRISNSLEQLEQLD